MDRLAKFLEKQYPRMATVLESNLKQRCFDNYEVFWDEEREDIGEFGLLSTSYDFVEANLAVQKALNQMSEIERQESGTGFEENEWGNEDSAPKGKKDNQESKVKGLTNEYSAISLDWSSNGSSIAVAYGKTNISTWCEYSSVVSIWQVFRGDYDPKKPQIEIEVPTCLTQVRFHPTDT